MKKGFTLIELLVVVLIIGILSAVALPQYRVAVEKSRATELMVNVKSLADAVDLYYLETGAFPTALADLSIQLPGKISTGDPENIALKSRNVCGLDLGDYWVFCRNEKHTIRFLKIVKNGAFGQTKGTLLCASTKDGKIEKRVCLSMGGKWLFSNDSWDFYVL